jgi:hypothetical protein
MTIPDKKSSPETFHRKKKKKKLDVKEIRGKVPVPVISSP